MSKFQPADISINFSKIRNQLGLKGISDEMLQDMVKHAVIDQLSARLGMDIRMDDLDVSSVQQAQTSRLEGKMRFAEKNWFDEKGDEIELATQEEIPYRVSVDETNHRIGISSNPGKAGIETKVEIDMSPGGLTNIKVFGPTDGLLATLVQKGDVALVKEGKFAGLAFSETHNNCMVLTCNSADPNSVLTMVDRMPNLINNNVRPQLGMPDVQYEESEEIDYGSSLPGQKPPSKGPGGMG